MLRANKTPLIRGPDGTLLRLLVGQYDGQRSTIQTASPLLMMDVHVAPNATLQLQLRRSFFVGTYVLSGTGTIGSCRVQPHSVATSQPPAIGPEDSTLSCQAGSDGMRFLLYAGEPIADPISVDGYFVCCTPEETRGAVADFDRRENRFAKGKSWSSAIAN